MFSLKSMLCRTTMLVSVVSVVSCTSLQAGSDAYSLADFSAYRSFSWVDDTPLIESSSSQVDISPLNVRRIQDAIQRQLLAKGYVLEASRDRADFSIAFTVGARDVIQVTDYPMYYRNPWRWRVPYYWPNVDVAMYTQGTLAIDVFDNEERQPVWHGWARKRITGADVKEPENAINATVSAILDAYPARTAD